MVHNMKIELSRREEIILCLVSAALVGALFGSIFAGGSSHDGEVSAFREDLPIEEGQSVSAQSLQRGTSTHTSFPPPLYVFESIEAEVHVHNTSGGILEINFTRDDKVIRTELVQDAARIVLSGYGEYRFRPSNLDVTLRAIDKEVRVTVLINISRRTREYNPLAVAIGYTIFVGGIILLTSYKKRP